MGWFDVISKGVTALVREFCFTFVNNSNIRVLMGTNGAGVTQAMPLYVAREKSFITQLKIDTRMTGVRSGGVDEAQTIADFQRAQIEPPSLEDGVEAQTVNDPTYRQVTVNGVAYLVVRADKSSNNVDYNVAAVQFRFPQLADLLLDDDNGLVDQANAFTDSTKVFWSTIRQLAGVDTYREVRGGFVNSKFPGPIRLARGDYIQLIWFGSNNFVQPTAGEAGVWGRYTGLISWEYEPESMTTDQNQEEDGTLDGPAYRKFANL